MLGTACGKCDRCAEEAPKAIASLLASNQSLNSKLKVMLSCVPARVELVDAAKVSLFDALRAQLYDENGEIR